MLDASKCVESLYEKEVLENLTTERLKKFRTRVYGVIGNQFYCCDNRCEFTLDTPLKKAQHIISEKNLKLINQVLYKKTH